MAKKVKAIGRPEKCSIRVDASDKWAAAKVSKYLADACEGLITSIHKSEHRSDTTITVITKARPEGHPLARAFRRGRKSIEAPSMVTITIG